MKDTGSVSGAQSYSAEGITDAQYHAYRSHIFQLLQLRSIVVSQSIVPTLYRVKQLRAKIDKAMTV